ncbi:SDR family NAD(P)-dependent oxidoreductase [Singulisphaera sp. PoT]|uniref:SDR family NAD(P)-dependent oxidoreductase n=1 Tax=Singulisphaera sp. PoT TaxID=3411797 RepID=UPI003BF5349B
MAKVTEVNSGGGVAIVTGSGQGIGLGIAEALCHAGFKVALSDVNGETAVESAARLRDQGHETLGLTLDVRSAEAWQGAVSEVSRQWGRLDLLVNNAGISPRGTIESTDEALWDLTLAINLKGPWLGIKSFLPLLKESRGAIVNIGSTRATRPMPGLFAYVTSKAGLLGLTRQVAAECLGSNVTCNMVAPGWVDTPGERIIQAQHGRPDFPEGVQNLTTSRDVGDAVAFLATPAGHKLNGVILFLDSGLHVADDAGMVYLPDEVRLRYHQPSPTDNR